MLALVSAGNLQQSAGGGISPVVWQVNAHASHTGNSTQTARKWGRDNLLACWLVSPLAAGRNLRLIYAYISWFRGWHAKFTEGCSAWVVAVGNVDSEFLCSLFLFTFVQKQNDLGSS